MPLLRRRVALLALLAVVLASCSGGLPGRAPGDKADSGFIGGDSVTLVPPEKRQPAPVVHGPAVSGTGTISSADYPGKVLVLNVWGSWCAPCRKEAPDLEAAAVETRDVAQFIGINIRDNNPATPRAFVRAFKVTYPHIYDPSGAQLVKFGGVLPANGIPTTLVIDREGRVAARVVGIVSRITVVTLVTDVAAGR